MNAHPRTGLFGRPILTVTVAVAALAGVGIGGVALANRDKSDPPQWQSAPAAAPSSIPSQRSPESAVPKEESAAADGEAISMSATGDIIMGSAPSKLPARDGDGFFDSVADGL